MGVLKQQKEMLSGLFYMEILFEEERKKNSPTKQK